MARPVKKTATKKVATKKTATKRVYVKKPKQHLEVDAVVQQAAAEAAPHPAALISMTNASFEAKLEAAREQGREAGHLAAVESFQKGRKDSFDRQAEALQSVDYIDLRELPSSARVGLLIALNELGYIDRDTTDGLLSFMCVDTWMQVDYLELNHVNKLVRGVSSAEDDSSVLTVHSLSMDVFFSASIGDNKPSVIEKDGVRYVRIN